MPVMPNAALAFIEPDKLRKYLLDPTHPDGGPKAALYIRFGFDAAAPERLEEALLKQAQSVDAAYVEDLKGLKYVVESEISTPVGRPLRVRSIWHVEREGDPPRLVTAYAR